MLPISTQPNGRSITVPTGSYSKGLLSKGYLRLRYGGGIMFGSFWCVRLSERFVELKREKRERETTVPDEKSH